jgi:hypothetical protein
MVGMVGKIREAHFMAARTQRERISVALSFFCLFFLDLQPKR